jgi:hypothetical protein
MQSINATRYFRLLYHFPHKTSIFCKVIFLIRPTFPHKMARILYLTVDTNPHEPFVHFGRTPKIDKNRFISIDSIMSSF